MSLNIVVPNVCSENDDYRLTVDKENFYYGQFSDLDVHNFSPN